LRQLRAAVGKPQVGTERKAPADLICMHPRRWGWLLAGMDSANRPLIIGDASAAVVMASTSFGQNSSTVGVASV
jgi:hypothetical protein